MCRGSWLLYVSMLVAPTSTQFRLLSVKGGSPTMFANPDPVQCPVQCIQSIDKGFSLGDSVISPKAFSHFIQGLNRAFDVGSRYGFGRCLLQPITFALLFFCKGKFSCVFAHRRSLGLVAISGQ